MKFIGDYQILREIGKGAFGRVLLAEKDGHQVAIKETLTRSRTALKAAQDESKLLINLNHKNVVRLFEYFTSGVPKRLYMIMEYIRGRELFDIMCDEQVFVNITEIAISTFIRQVCLGLEYLNNCFIVHLDLKPENLVVSGADGVYKEIKIVDFGLARKIEAGERFCCMNGTRGYMAPEQLSFEQISDKTDMWAVGCITYEMLSGWMAFEFESDIEFVQKVTKMDWTFDLGDENPFDEISQNGKNFISELLLKHPDQRMSASDALAHPWITGKNEIKEENEPKTEVLETIDRVIAKMSNLKAQKSSENAKEKLLVGVRQKLRKVQAKRRWKKAIKTVRATVRMRFMLRGSQAVLEVPKELENEILRKIINNWIGTDFDVEAEMREIYSEMLNNSQE